METTNVVAGGLLLLCSAVIAVGSGTIDPSVPVLVLVTGALGLSVGALLFETASRRRAL